jgi:hypothetical protein
MSQVVRRHWPSDLSAGLSPRDRMACQYNARKGREAPAELCRRSAHRGARLAHQS